jgi:hypothetical protein
MKNILQNAVMLADAIMHITTGAICAIVLCYLLQYLVGLMCDYICPPPAIESTWRTL